MKEPLITDWINSIAALIGIPLVIWGIVKLFIKDKNQERKLNSLEKLALSQDEMIKKMTEQISELSKQTSEYQYQSELLKDSNNIISKQLELQNQIFLHNKLSEEKKIELQKIERINKIKPRFVNGGAASSSLKMTLSLKNKGNTAKKARLEKIEGQNINFVNLNPQSEIEQGKTLEIVGNISPDGKYGDNGNRLFTIDLFFEDIDGNSYKQRIINSKIGELELIEK